MALSVNTVWEVRTGGNDTNGGGFVTGASGTDHSQQDAAQYSVTDGVTAGTTTITSATANFGTDVVGNIIYVQGGTGSVTANRYEILTRVSSTEITVDRSTGLTAGTGVTLIIGGALLSPGLITNAAPCAAVSKQRVWIKAGTYSITSTTAGTAGGRLNPSAALIWTGYNSTRGDLGTRPVLQASGISSTTLLNLSNASSVINIEVDGATLSSITGISLSLGFIYRALVKNCVTGYSLGSTSVTNSIATGNTTVAFLGGNLSYCISYENSCSGFTFGSGSTYVGCIADSNSGASSHGFTNSATENGIQLINCVAYNNGGSGFNVPTSNGSNFINCIAEANAAYGFVVGTLTGIGRVNCATYNNTSGATSGTFELEANNQTLSGSPFTNAASQDFSLNNTASAGAACRAAGLSNPPLGGTGYLDIGALQHQDPGGGGGISILGATFGSPHIPVSYR